LDPIALTRGTYSDLSTLAASNDYVGGPSCTAYHENGPDQVYAIDVPTGQTLDVMAMATPKPTEILPYDLALYLVAGDPANCLPYPEPMVCVGQPLTWDNGTGPESAEFVNQTSATVRVFAIVDSQGETPAVDRTNAGTYSLTVSFK
jgi:hypothetical protein